MILTNTSRITVVHNNYVHVHVVIYVIQEISQRKNVYHFYFINMLCSLSLFLSTVHVLTLVHNYVPLQMFTSAPKPMVIVMVSLAHCV